MNPAPTAPLAPIVNTHGRVTYVQCPYCRGVHAHYNVTPGKPNHRAPGCGIYRSAADRLTGYHIN